MGEYSTHLEAAVVMVSGQDSPNPIGRVVCAVVWMEVVRVHALSQGPLRLEVRLPLCLPFSIAQPLSLALSQPLTRARDS